MVLCLAFTGLLFLGAGRPGISPSVRSEFRDVGLDRYVGQFAPTVVEDLGNGDNRYTFDTQAGNGPICIVGTPYSVTARVRDPKNVIIVLRGGGACWQGFYRCNLTGSPAPTRGVFADSFTTPEGHVINNPLVDWSIVYLPYCDGSFHSGDNDVVDPQFPSGPVRYHRGLRNLTAGLDLARRLFPQAKKVLLAGGSAGGYGTLHFAPSLFRLIFPPNVKLYVLNDSGPVYNLDEPEGVADAITRGNDWRHGQFYPVSCTTCGAVAQPAEMLAWRLANDNNVREALFSTDGDEGVRPFFHWTDDPEEVYRNVLLRVFDPIHAAYPDRFKRFIRVGTTHLAFYTDGFYTFDANGVPLYQWVADFVNEAPGWSDIVEDR